MVKRGRGVVYVAIGPGSYGEMKRSLGSLHLYMPEMSVTVFTDQVADGKWIKQVPSYVPGYKELPAYPHAGLLAKSFYLRRPVYQYQLFLDTDTLVCARLDALFALIEGKRFDLALSHDSGRLMYSKLKLPLSFPVMNTGVILTRSCRATKSIMAKQWRWFRDEVVEDGNWSADQSMWQRAIYENKSARIGILPPEYNFRWIFPAFAGGAVKIVHGHGENITRVRDYINVTDEPRIWDGKNITAFHAVSDADRSAIQKRIDRMTSPRHIVRQTKLRK